MSLSLVDYPVKLLDGKVRNIFAGFSAVEVQFKREDVVIEEVVSGTNAQIQINIIGDITGSLSVNEDVYLYAKGVVNEYDSSYKVTAIVFNAPNTEVTVDGAFLEIATVGYFNFKQDYFVESFLVSPANILINKYASPTETDGAPNGEVYINASMLVDALKNSVLIDTGEVSEAREICQMKYREVWRENQTEPFVLIDSDPIIITYSAENVEIETFINGFDVPIIWAGYPFAINVTHSTANSVGLRIEVNFDELDINKNDVVLNNKLTYFNGFDFGFLQSNFADKTVEIDDTTEYIRFNAIASNVPDFKLGDFKSGDFKTY